MKLTARDAGCVPVCQCFHAALAGPSAERESDRAG